MKRIIALTITAGLALAACDKKAENAQSAATPSGAPKADAATTAAPTPTPKPAPTDAPAADRATAEGTVRLFIAAMGVPDYDAALALVDPTSDCYVQIQEAQSTMINSEGKEDQGVSLKNLMVMLFTRAWHGATTEKLGEQEGLVRFRLVFEKAEPVTVDVRNSTGEWLLIAPQNIVVLDNTDFEKALPKQPAPGQAPPTPPSTPPATPPASGG